MLKPFIAIAFMALAAGSASAATTVSVEAAGVQASTVQLVSGGTETFDGFSSGYKTSLTAGFGSYSGTYSGADFFVNDVNTSGGAGGIGKFYSSRDTTSLNLSGTVNYFGLWASALDGDNTVSFFKAGSLIDTVSLTGYPLSDAYYGNPNDGQDLGEKFAFFNFIVAGGYDQVNFVQNGGGGFESDNHTAGIVAAVPEPATWALMIGGLGLVGGTMRRRKGAALRPA